MCEFVFLMLLCLCVHIPSFCPSEDKVLQRRRKCRSVLGHAAEILELQQRQQRKHFLDSYMRMQELETDARWTCLNEIASCVLLACAVCH